MVRDRVNWLRAHYDGSAAFVVLASTHERALEIVPLEVSGNMLSTFRPARVPSRVDAGRVRIIGSVSSKS